MQDFIRLQTFRNCSCVSWTTHWRAVLGFMFCKKLGIFNGCEVGIVFAIYKVNRTIIIY